MSFLKFMVWEGAWASASSTESRLESHTQNAVESPWWTAKLFVLCVILVLFVILVTKPYVLCVILEFFVSFSSKTICWTCHSCDSWFWELPPKRFSDEPSKGLPWTLLQYWSLAPRAGGPKGHSVMFSFRPAHVILCTTDSCQAATLFWPAQLQTLISEACRLNLPACVKYRSWPHSPGRTTELSPLQLQRCPRPQDEDSVL